MRTSNKILLGIFIGPLIILTAVHVALYAKYKSGHYVIMKTVVEDRYTRQTLKGISNIEIYGLQNCNLIPADTFKLEIEKSDNARLHYTINGATLVIHGDTIVKQTPGRHDDIQRSYQDVNIYIPSGVNINASNSEITLHGSKDSAKAPSYNLSMNDEASLKVNEEGNDTSHVYFKALTIKSFRSSGVELTAHTYVFDMDLILTGSSFADNGAGFEKIKIDADKTSNISLNGANLQKIGLVHQ